jgi:ATP-dependent DNA ligase
MMKRRDSPYNAGARVSHTLKAKITATADVVVVEKGVDGKDNARVALLVNGRVTPIGTISTLGKGPIAVGDVVEVGYLWATPSNTLAQPRIIRLRRDKTVADITDASQLRQVDKSVLALAAKRLRLLLEQKVMS